MGERTKSQTVRLRDLVVPLEAAGDPQPILCQEAARRLGLDPSAVGSPRIVRRALDARRRFPRYVFSVDLDLDASVARRALAGGQAHKPPELQRCRWQVAGPPPQPRPVVVGAGPAGLFAAVTLAEAGWPPLLLERGQKVGPRAKEVSRLYRDGVLNPESNVCYGEGGAGAFSDGKLRTRVGDGRVVRVLEKLVELGADPDILVDSRPHLGTDRLVALLERVRQHLLDLGATLRFSTRVSSFEVVDGRLRAVVLDDGERVEVASLVLSTGHSAVEVWEALQSAGLELQARPFAIGFRVEHPQALIDELQYGAAVRRAKLPAADYRLTYNEPTGARRGVYSFCMCPGGVVVPTPTRAGELCINGMSHAARGGRFANSALVVTVSPDDFAASGHHGVLAGVAFARHIERAAYAAGGGGFVAPAARVTDYVAGRVSRSLGATSYRRGLVAADLRALVPMSVTQALDEALKAFDGRMRGFVTAEATLVGVETRTASAVRVPRGNDLQAVGAAGLYPAGEGMGYGGGIVSAAVDGIRAAEAILEAAGAKRWVG